MQRSSIDLMKNWALTPVTNGTDDTNGVQAQKFRYKMTRICWLGVHLHLRQFWPLNLESIENATNTTKDLFAYFRPMLKNRATEPVLTYRSCLCLGV